MPDAKFCRLQPLLNEAVKESHLGGLVDDITELPAFIRGKCMGSRVIIALAKNAGCLQNGSHMLLLT